MRIEERLKSIERKIDDLLLLKNENEGYFDVKRAGKFASVSGDTVRRWVGEGRIPGYKPNGKILVKKADLEKFIETSKIETVDLDQIVKKVMSKLRQDRTKE
jgi:excisionase family DNA binding protein